MNKNRISQTQQQHQQNNAEIEQRNDTTNVSLEQINRFRANQIVLRYARHTAEIEFSQITFYHTFFFTHFENWFFIETDCDCAGSVNQTCLSLILTQSVDISHFIETSRIRFFCWNGFSLWFIKSANRFYDVFCCCCDFCSLFYLMDRYCI